MNDSLLSTLAAVGFFAVIITWMTWRDHRRDTNAKSLSTAIPKVNVRKLLSTYRRPLAVLAVAVLTLSMWWYYGPTTFDAIERKNWIKGTLELSGTSAIARLHNNRDAWIVEEVVLFVFSGKATPCNKAVAGCSPDGGLPSIRFEDARYKGDYRCGNRIGARPNTTFECAFTYPYSVGWGERHGWTVSEIVARRVNPLGL